MSERTRYILWTVLFVAAFAAGTVLVSGLNRRQVDERIKSLDPPPTGRLE
jgi:hypothetical protein